MSRNWPASLPALRPRCRWVPRPGRPPGGRPRAAAWPRTHRLARPRTGRATRCRAGGAACRIPTSPGWNRVISNPVASATPDMSQRGTNGGGPRKIAWARCFQSVGFTPAACRLIARILAFPAPFKMPPSSPWQTGTVAMPGTGGAVRGDPGDLLTLWAVMTILSFQPALTCVRVFECVPPPGPSVQGPVLSAAGTAGGCDGSERRSSPARVPGRLSCVLCLEARDRARRA